jgi:site-specific DNA-adenine methylase
MWSYYGSKKRIVNYYPPPKFDRIIEPFVGAGSYVLKYWEYDVTIVDKYEVIYKIWKWLQECEISDIDKLPHHMTYEDNLNNYTFDCEEAKMMMGFIIAKGVERPRYKPTSRVTNSRPNTINYTLNKIKGNLHKIKHWKILHGSYLDLDNKKATWFIDPPYQFGGHAYVENKIDYKQLADWCKTRKGQIIVCENTKADWLPFKPMIKNNGTHKMTTEAIWSNLKTNYDSMQLSFNLFETN